MAKLIYRTKTPKKGAVNFESTATHSYFAGTEGIPSFEREGLDLINKAMFDLIGKLDALGYDQTTVRFSISLKPGYKTKNGR